MCTQCMHWVHNFYRRNQGFLIHKGGTQYQPPIYPKGNIVTEMVKLSAFIFSLKTNKDNNATFNIIFQVCLVLCSVVGILFPSFFFFSSSSFSIFLFSSSSSSSSSSILLLSSSPPHPSSSSLLRCCFFFSPAFLFFFSSFFFFLLQFVFFFFFCFFLFVFCSSFVARARARATRALKQNRLV